MYLRYYSYAVLVPFLLECRALEFGAYRLTLQFPAWWVPCGCIQEESCYGMELRRLAFRSNSQRRLC